MMYKLFYVNGQHRVCNHVGLVLRMLLQALNYLTHMEANYIYKLPSGKHVAKHDNCSWNHAKHGLMLVLYSYYDARLV